MDRFIPPQLEEKRFTCPHCGTLAGIEWSSSFVFISKGQYVINSSYAGGEFQIFVSTCRACGNYHLWLEDKMIVPTTNNIPMPNDDMPDNVKKIYLEARDVFPYSAKSAAALMRLAVQELCVELGGKGKKIDEDIKLLVQNGLPIKIQQALDTIRVIGNNAVHPGTIDLNDNPEMAA